MKIYSYVVARDFGFAPNPFHGYCTLATCRADIRGRAEVGDWIIGTGSSSREGVDKLIYIMQVEETLSFNQYFKDKRFEAKKPDLTKSGKFNMGDNIYYLNDNNEWIVLDSHHYRPGSANNQVNIDKDTSQPIVLISQKFSYFGDKSILIPEYLHFMIKEKQGYRVNFEDDEQSKIIDWLENLIKEKSGIIGLPASWKI